jgi:hypothetical protein
VVAIAAALVTILLPPAPAKATTADIGAALFFDLNEVRIGSGLVPYAYSTELATLAELWSQRQAEAGDIFHNLALFDGLPDGRWVRLNENVGVGNTEADIEAAFVASPDHLANYTNVRYTHVGIGVVVTPDGAIYVTEDFGQASQAVEPEVQAAPTTIATSKAAPSTTVAASPTTRPRPTVVPHETTASWPASPPQVPTPRLRQLIEQLQILDRAR